MILAPQKIQSVILCANTSKLTVSARSGGHSYAGYALEGNMVVDLSNLKEVTVNSDNTTVVQTGNGLGEVATKRIRQRRTCSHARFMPICKQLSRET